MNDFLCDRPMIYAPIVIGTYNRFDHFVKCIESLKKNFGAEKTTLIIGIDFPVNKKHVLDNDKIKTYCREISGFGRVIVKEWTENLGPRKNFQELREIAFSISDRVILTEDDNVFHVDFLNFINLNLEIYKNDGNVFSVCGYNYPIKFKGVEEKDNLMLKAFSAWGVGLWKEKFDIVKFELGEYNKFLDSTRNVFKVSKTLGQHVLLHYFYAEKNKKIYGDTWISLYLYDSDKYCVFPAKTLVKNIGNDGSGANCGIDEKINNQEVLGVRKNGNIIHLESDQHRMQLNEYFKLSLRSKFKFAILLFFRKFGAN